MRIAPPPKTQTALDYAFIAPAILLLLSFTFGLIPALFCYLNKVFFAYLSLSMFIISIGFHVYTLILWRRYWGMAPLAYAIGQPITHFTIMVFASIVSATMTCENLATSRIPAAFEIQAPLDNILYLDNFSEILDNIDKQNLPSKAPPNELAP